MVAEVTLPRWRRPLVIVAHPDDESFGLGAVLSTFVEAGAYVSVLCLTRGEASTLRGVDGDLSAIRAEELGAAALELGITNVHLRDFPDGNLRGVAPQVLLDEALAIAKLTEPDGIVAFDTSGVSGHPDHIQATEIAIRLSAEVGVGALGWTLPMNVVTTLNHEFGSTLVGREDDEIDIEVSVDRSKQRRAVECHPSQLSPSGIIWRRMELQSDKESLRWLYRPD
jgi:LmbE family N-acetylglucosaminyl deacetylase